jgi:hypothetical protein
VNGINYNGLQYTANTSSHTVFSRDQVDGKREKQDQQHSRQLPPVMPAIYFHFLRFKTVEGGAKRPTHLN